MGENGYILNSEYKGKRQKVMVTDSQGYQYNANCDSLLKGHKPDMVNKNNPFSITNIKRYLLLNSRDFELLSDNYENAHNDLWWKCKVCNSPFECSWNHIKSNRGCPYCSGQRVNHTNSLASLNPELAKEWHPTLNGDLTPHDVTCNSGREVWWKCSKQQSHEWKAFISNRSRQHHGCPYCGGHLPTKENNFEILYPEIAKEWNYEMNKKSPHEYLSKTNQRVWWKCSACNHEWFTTINSRTNMKSNCPKCAESKGEKRIREWLEKYQINFTVQKDYPDLLGLGGGLLSYDFYLPDHNLLIEYQGEFHDGRGGRGNYYVKENLKNQQEHDKRKREYAKSNNIPLLEIWYWDFENIDKILENNLL